VPELRIDAMNPLTRDDVMTTLGDVDETVIADIMKTGATADELAEARAWLANDEPLMNSGKPLAAGRVGRLVEILGSLEEEEPGPAGYAA
jgi:hypothetical protein